MVAVIGLEPQQVLLLRVVDAHREAVEEEVLARAVLAVEAPLLEV